MATISGKNKSILAGLMGDAPVTETPLLAPREAPAPDRLASRLTGLARVTSGDVKEKTLLLVEPGRCRLWSRHNRRYDLLNEAACADLLESLRSQGEQEFPAIVRRIENDPAFDYEVICGARRHWSVSYLRNVEHREIKFLVEVRELSDEAAFRLADVENRSRQDICDYERALDYRSAVETYYGGVARRMAERLEVKEAWLSRFLELAKLPKDIVEAFGDIRQIRENHTRVIKPLLSEPTSRARVMAKAVKLAALQNGRLRAGQGALEATSVLAELKTAAKDAGSAPAEAPADMVFRSEAGEPLFKLVRKGQGKASVELSLASAAKNADFIAAFEKALTQLRPNA